MDFNAAIDKENKQYYKVISHKPYDLRQKEKVQSLPE